MTVNSTKVLKIFLHDVRKTQCLLLLSFSNQAKDMYHCVKLNINWGQPSKLF